MTTCFHRITSSKGSMILLTCFAVSYLVPAALACYGFEPKNIKIEKCKGDSGLVKFENFLPEVSDDCTVVVKGCIVVGKTVEWGNATYKAIKVGTPLMLSGKEDLCKLFTDSKKSPEITLGFKMFNLEQRCPVRAGKICGNPQGVNLAKYLERYKSQMWMAVGDYEGTGKGTSSAGSVCVKVSGSVVRKAGSKPKGFPIIG